MLLGMKRGEAEDGINRELKKWKLILEIFLEVHTDKCTRSLESDSPALPAPRSLKT